MNTYIKMIIRFRYLTIVLTLLLTMLAVYEAKNIKIIIDMNATLPQSHRYISTTNLIEKIFGSKYIVEIGITPKQGDIYQTPILQKVQNINNALLRAKDIVPDNLLSLAARRAKNINGNEDGLEVQPLMTNPPVTREGLDALKNAVQKNPVYINSIVSNDGRSTAIIAEFKEPPDGFRSILAQIEPIVASERDDNTEIVVGGGPSYLAGLEIYSERMIYLLPASIVILSLVLFSAFRTKQGLILPLATAGIAVAWGMGVMGASGIPMDVFNATTPILILAVATGHAVQMLKRYYEEYYHLRHTTKLTPNEANNQAILTSITRLAPVMITAGIVACLGFFSLVIFEISTVRTFGIFTGIGILAALVLELTFIPALRSILSAPEPLSKVENSTPGLWDKFAELLSSWIIGNRKILYVSFGVFIIFFALGITRLTTDNSVKSFFASTTPIAKEDEILNNQLSGTNTLYVLVQGTEQDAIKDPQAMQSMDKLQRFIETQPEVGKTISIADFIKRMNKAMHGDNAEYFKIPDSQELISQYLLLYSISGEPNDFNAYVDNDYRSANLVVYLKTDSSAYVEQLIGKINDFYKSNPNDKISLKFGGSVTQSAALSEVMVRGKILNIVQIAAVVFLISSLIFRSILAGTLVLLPLLIAVLVNFGLMGWSGIFLNVPTSLTSAMAVGIGADYAIYLIYRLREEILQEKHEIDAIKTVIATAGKAILFVAIAVAAGYGVLLLSFGFNVHKWLAILIASAMLVSAMAAILLIPALIITFKPSFIYKQNNAGEKLPNSYSTLTLLAFIILLFPHHSFAEDVDLRKIMETNLMVTKPSNSIFDSTFTLINKSGQERIRKTFGATKLQENGKDYTRMTRFLSPVDVKGTVSLLVEHAESDDDIWIYLPALQKVRRLVSNNKKDSFVGTDLSYGDVIGYKISEWNYKLIREETIDSQPAYVIESTPINGTVSTATGYSKRIDWIGKENLVTIKSEYADMQGQPLKSTLYKNIELVDAKNKKWQPMHIEVSNVQTEHKTIIQFENFKVNQQINDDFFTTRYMEKE